jgi:hypothetical protein
MLASSACPRAFSSDRKIPIEIDSEYERNSDTRRTKGQQIAMGTAPRVARIAAREETLIAVDADTHEA